MANNLAQLTKNDFTFSSEQTGFEASNCLNNFRSSTWKMNGHFEITASNQNLYINDGSDKTVAITVGDYTSGAALATQIQTDLNATSSGWTVTYDNTTLFKFTLTNSSSVTIRLSVTTNAIWDTIGFITTTNKTGTSFPAEVQRNHTNEYLRFDFGYQAPVTFIGAVADIATTFPISSSATVTLQGNNVDLFDSPPFSKTLTITDKGIFTFNLDIDDARYRYWRFNIVDRDNTVGPGIELGSVYLGDFETTTDRNANVGFTDTLRDPSISSGNESEAGVLYFDERTRFTQFDNIAVRYLEEADKNIIKSVFNNVGLTTPFYFSLDPLLNVSSDITNFTKFVRFVSEPVFINETNCRFSTILSLREVV